jgi:hypothetical protein
MKETAFIVETDLFNSTEVKDNFINPECFGEDFAGWLRPRLSEPPYQADEPIQEDWGWAILVKKNPDTFTIAIGLMGEGSESETAEWRIGLSWERTLNLPRSLFKGPDPAAFQGLRDRLESSLRAEPRIRITGTE